ncbi:Ser/Thr-rich protein T10 in DGCR region [Ceratobasidium sp. AG-Ba]|nr:Ser/Thr-rich protein T10 in DGCR region [Ceratobasidium sp. AG-Ba]
MCVAFWTLTHPEYALILAANRDEFISRPTIPAEWHDFDSSSNSDILSGRDVMAGGTWLGVNRKGDFALLTNITELIGKFVSSRGELVSKFLKSTSSPDSHLSQYFSSLVTEQRVYAGFNLLALSPKSRGDGTIEYEGSIITNSGGGGKIAARPLTEDESSCCGLSNSNDCAEPRVDENPDWPKLSEGKSLFKEIVGSENWKEDELLETLFDMMSTQNPIPPTSRYSLRTTITVPPIPVEPKTWSSSITPDSVPASNDAAPALQSQQTDFYCTRLTTVVLVKRDGSVTFVERDIWQMIEGKSEPAKADKTSQRKFCFQVGR